MIEVPKSELKIAVKPDEGHAAPVDPAALKKELAVSATTYRQRFVDAVILLCKGKVPPREYFDDFFNGGDGVALRNFALRYGPPWCQGSALLDAASVIALRPRGEGHQIRPTDAQRPPRPARPAKVVTFDPGQTGPVW